MQNPKFYFRVPLILVVSAMKLCWRP